MQLSDARHAAERLALRNITLHAADICEVGPTLGEFDHIVAHGVMSWVSDAVRDAIFAPAAPCSRRAACSTSATTPIPAG